MDGRSTHRRFRVRPARGALACLLTALAVLLVAAPAWAGTPPSNSSAPVISPTGTIKDGQKLTVSNGVWTGTTPITYSYQWQSCDSLGGNCTDIAGATANNYTLTSA